MLTIIRTVVFVIAVIFSANVFAAKNALPVDNMVAIVNESIITQSELREAMDKVKKQLHASNISLPPQDVFRKQVLDQLINKKIQLQMAEQLGIKITDEDVKKAIQLIADDHKMSAKELYERVNEQGITSSEYRKEIRDQLTIQKLQQKALGAKILVTPQEVSDFMRSKTWLAYNTKEYHLEDILIALPEAPSAQQVMDARKRANALAAKIRQGLNFREAAVAESGEDNALQGGDLGWRKLPEIPSAFAEEIIQMKVNAVAGPIQTPNGFHLIRLVGVKNLSEKLTSAQQKQQVEQLIFQRKLDEALQNWVAKLRSDSYVKIEPGK